MTEINDQLKTHDKLVPFYDIESTYAITIQPGDNLQFLNKNYTSDSRLLRFRQHYMEILRDNLITNYYFKIELSEPKGDLNDHHAGSRLHLHGIIMFDNKKQIINFLLKGLKNIKDKARITIKKISSQDNLKIWWDYINKQKLISNDITTLSNYIDSHDCFHSLNKKLQDKRAE